MRSLFLIFILCLSSSLYSQKGYVLLLKGDGVNQVDRHIRTEFRDSISLIEYVRDLQNKAIKKGYLLASVDTLFFKGKNAVVHFYLGEILELIELKVIPEDRHYLPSGRLKENAILEIPFTPKDLGEVMHSIQNELLRNGYPFYSVELNDPQISQSVVRADFKIKTGPKVYWTDIHIKGDSSVSRRYISSLIGIREGDLYNEELLKEIGQKIGQVPFLKEIKPYEILFTPKGAELFLYLDAQPLSSVNGVLGLQPDPVSGKVGVTGDLDLKLLNVLHRGELMVLNWRSIRSQTQSINLRFNYPFLFSSPFGTDVRFQLYKRDTSFLELRSTIGVQYMLRNGSYLRTFYQNYSSSLLSGADGNPQFSKLASLNTNSYGMALYHRKLDYIPNPRKGSVIQIEFSAGARKTKETDTSEVFRSTAYRSSIQVEYFLPILPRHVIRFSAAGEFYIAEEIYENEVFRFGGQQTLRGFNEEELYATSRSVFSLEYRFLLDKNSNVFAFYDQGFYENNASVYRKDAPFGFGLGLSFGTKAGIFSISYALGQQMKNPVKLNNGKIHFGYIAYF